jgi:DNA-binding transcriptional ArsR family regulator
MTVDHLMTLLGDTTRRTLYEHIARGGEIGVSQLVERVEVSQPAVSQHLKKLHDSGLIAERRDGRRVLYRTRPEALDGLHDWLEEYQRFWPQKMQALRALLNEMPDKSEDT